METGHTPYERVVAAYSQARVPERAESRGLLSSFQSWMRALPHRGADPVELLGERPSGPPAAPDAG